MVGVGVVVGVVVGVGVGVVVVLAVCPVDRAGEYFICLECWTTWDLVQHRASGRKPIKRLFEQCLPPVVIWTKR